MLRTLYKIGAYLLVVLGIVHLLLTPLNYERFTLNALWFAGSGVSIVFAGFLNLVVLGGGARDRLAVVLSIVASLTLALLFVAALYVLPEPQVFFGAALSAFEAVAAFLLRKQAAGDDDHARV